MREEARFPARQRTLDLRKIGLKTHDVEELADLFRLLPLDHVRDRLAPDVAVRHPPTSATTRARRRQLEVKGRRTEEA